MSKDLHKSDLWFTDLTVKYMNSRLHQLNQITVVLVVSVTQQEKLLRWHPSEFEFSV